MLEQPLPNRAATELHGCDLFAPHLDSFVATLEKLGYAISTVRQHLRLLRDFAHWLGRQGLTLAQLQEPLADQFLEQRRLRRRLSQGEAPTVRHFLEHLRKSGAYRVGWFSSYKVAPPLGMGVQLPPEPEPKPLPAARVEVVVFVPQP